MPRDSIYIAYFTLELIGLISLFFLTCTFVFATSVRRHATVINNTLLWTIACILTSLLFFTRTLHGAEPPELLCQIQSATVLALPPTLSAAILTLIFKVWSLAWSVSSERATFLDEPRYLTILLVIFPHVVFFGSAAGAAVVGQRVGAVRIIFYCGVRNTGIAIFSAATAGAFMTIAFVFQVWTIILVIYRYRQSHRLGRSEIGDIDLALFSRVLLFGAFIVMALVLSFFSTNNFAESIPDILAASIAPTMFVVFASQKDVLRAWNILPASCQVDALPRRLAALVDVDLRRQWTPHVSNV